MRSIWNAPGITEVEVERSPCIFYFKIILTLRCAHHIHASRDPGARVARALRSARTNPCTCTRSPALSARYVSERFPKSEMRCRKCVPPLALPPCRAIVHTALELDARHYMRR